ncbi:MAG TPA: hypothetical protein VGM88_34695 [Kofleriaceae bacterium]|jgi:hypothetical protein
MKNLAAEALALACPDARVRARLGGPLGDAARAAIAQTAVDRAQLVAALRAPVPPGLRGADPSWIEHGLDEAPAAARAAVATGGSDGPIGVWLARWACAELPPLPPLRAWPPAKPHHAARLSGVDLARWLHAAGADQLAFALAAAGTDGPRSAGRDALRVAARLVGDELSDAANRIREAPRAGQLGPTRAAIARCKLTLDERALIRIGARAIAPHLDALVRRQLAVRLPRAVGMLVLRELVRDADVPRDQAPAWPALIA